VPTAKWEGITSRTQDITGIFERLGSPLIVKPAVSGGSMGLCVKNVVENEAELIEQIHKIFDGYRGWELSSGGIVVEQFVNGPEYTTMIVGASDQPRNCVIYTPVERVFHPSLPDKEKFLSFDRLWEIYEDETPMPGDEHFYQYTSPHASLIRKIKRISWDAYVSVGGKGYTRVDLRMDKETGAIYVLEVNAQCGLSDDEDYTSIGAILRMSNKSFTQMVVEIINDAALRWMKKNRVRKLVKSYQAV
jgi:D-alanine-D-alanine ligase